MVRLVCIDVDGTLVGSNGQVHERVWEAAARARDAGLRLALSSGRPGFGITRRFAEQLDPGGWHVFQNGASVVELASGRSHSAPLSRATVSVLVERARAVDRLLELYADSDYAWEGPPRRAREHAALLGVPFQERPFAALAGEVVRAQWVVGHAETEAIARESHPELVLSLSSSPAMPDTRFVNLTRSGVDKSSALRMVAELYGLAMSEVMFVGDIHNDESAMRLAGWPVAMANAEPSLRAVARDIVGHVDDGGVAEALELAIATRG